MRSMRSLPALLLHLHWSPLSAAGFEPEPLRQIQEDVGASCAVEPVKSFLSLAANNGFRVEQWTVKTCNGLAKYEVSYYPPQFFPDHDNPYAVRRID